MAQAGWLQKQKYIFQSSEAWKSQIRIQQVLGSGEVSLPGLQMVSLLHPHMVFHPNCGILHSKGSPLDVLPLPFRATEIYFRNVET